MAEWFQRHTERIERLVETHMPSGSGWDRGTSLDLQESTPDKLVFVGAYHHMTDHGTYDGCTDHAIIVTPSLAHGFDVRVTGRDRNQIKNILVDVFEEALRVEIDDQA